MCHSRCLKTMNRWVDDYFGIRVVKWLLVLYKPSTGRRTVPDDGSARWWVHEIKVGHVINAQCLQQHATHTAQQTFSGTHTTCILDKHTGRHNCNSCVQHISAAEQDSALQSLYGTAANHQQIAIDLLEIACAAVHLPPAPPSTTTTHTRPLPQVAPTPYTYDMYIYIKCTADPQVAATFFPVFPTFEFPRVPSCVRLWFP